MRKSLNFKMVSFFSILAVISLFVISFVIYQSSTQLVRESVGKQAESIVKKTVEKIDSQQYAAIAATLKENKDYDSLRKKLNEIRTTDELKYLYTMSRKKTDHGYDYFYVVDGMPLNSNDASALGEKEKDIDSFPLIKKTFNTGKLQVEMNKTKEYGGILSAYIPIQTSSGKIVGILGADIDVNNVYQAMGKNRLTMMMITLAVLLTSIVVIFLFSNYLTKPLKQLGQKVKQVGEGDLSVQFDITREDEIGQLAKEFQHMTDNLKNVVGGINYHSSMLKNTSAGLTERTSELISASKQITASIKEIAAGAEKQKHGSSEIELSMDSMAKGVHHIASASLAASDRSSSTLQEAESGKNAVEKVILHMEEINQSVGASERAIQTLEDRSKEISKMVDVISEISAQTNLLALNAAIEAARAGENGKGFAVVANEVRQLAEQSAQSAKQIAKLVEDIFQDTSRSVSAMKVVTEDARQGSEIAQNASAAFAKIYRLIQDVAGQIEEVSAASEQISASAEEVYSESSQMAKITETTFINTSSAAHATDSQDLHVNKMAESIQDLAKMASDLNELILQFKL